MHEVASVVAVRGPDARRGRIRRDRRGARAGFPARRSVFKMLRLVLLVPILSVCDGAVPTGRKQFNPGKTALQDAAAGDAQEWAGTISFAGGY